MAYLVVISAPICGQLGCKRIADFTLHNEWNAVVNRYCARHCEKARDDLREQEARSGRAAGNTTFRGASSQ
jgi:hypothetical protein